MHQHAPARCCPPVHVRCALCARSARCAMVQRPRLRGPAPAAPRAAAPRPRAVQSLFAGRARPSAPQQTPVLRLHDSNASRPPTCWPPGLVCKHQRLLLLGGGAAAGCRGCCRRLAVHAAAWCRRRSRPCARLPALRPQSTLYYPFVATRRAFLNGQGPPSREITSTAVPGASGPRIGACRHGEQRRAGVRRVRSGAAAGAAGGAWRGAAARWLSNGGGRVRAPHETRCPAPRAPPRVPPRPQPWRPAHCPCCGRRCACCWRRRAAAARPPRPAAADGTATRAPATCRPVRGALARATRRRRVRGRRGRRRQECGRMQAAATPRARAANARAVMRAPMRAGARAAAVVGSFGAAGPPRAGERADNAYTEFRLMAAGIDASCALRATPEACAADGACAFSASWVRAAGGGEGMRMARAAGALPMHAHASAHMRSRRPPPLLAAGAGLPRRRDAPHAGCGGRGAHLPRHARGRGRHLPAGARSCPLATACRPAVPPAAPFAPALCATLPSSCGRRPLPKPRPCPAHTG